jgi:hypothetical protein
MHQNHEPREPYSLCDTGATLPCGPTGTLIVGRLSNPILSSIDLTKLADSREVVISIKFHIHLIRQYNNRKIKCGELNGEY